MHRGHKAWYVDAAVYGVPASITIKIMVGEEEVVNDIVTDWDELHLSRIEIQGTRRRKERVAYLKIINAIFSHTP